MFGMERCVHLIVLLNVKSFYYYHITSWPALLGLEMTLLLSNYHFINDEGVSTSGTTSGKGSRLV